MYAIALVRYRRPIEEVVAATEGHRAYLRQLKDSGTLVAAGPMDPRYGGIFLLKVPDENPQRALDAVRDNDPFYQQHIAQVRADVLERRRRQGRSRSDLELTDYRRWLRAVSSAESDRTV